LQPPALAAWVAVAVSGEGAGGVAVGLLVGVTGTAEGVGGGSVAPPKLQADSKSADTMQDNDRTRFTDASQPEKFVDLLTIMPRFARLHKSTDSGGAG
jgi:hypothetical protein